MTSVRVTSVWEWSELIEIGCWHKETCQHPISLDDDSDGYEEDIIITINRSSRRSVMSSSTTSKGSTNASTPWKASPCSSRLMNCRKSDRGRLRTYASVFSTTNNDALSLSYHRHTPTIFCFPWNAIASNIVKLSLNMCMIKTPSVPTRIDWQKPAIVTIVPWDEEPKVKWQPSKREKGSEALRR